MNFLCEGRGRPTVLLEAGAGGSTLDWHRVQPTIARSTRVCSYDRAGMGFSDPGPLPRTTHAIVADFEALLKSAGIGPPYIIVAHSLGSYQARLYADKHLREVVGMLLLDPSVEYQDRRFAAVGPQFSEALQRDLTTQEECLRRARQGSLTAEMPIFKECSYADSKDPQFSEELYQVQIRRRLSLPFRETYLSETREMDDADSAELVAARRSYGAMPLVILTQSLESADAYPGMTAEQIDALNALWMRMHDELAALSSKGVNQRVERSGHYIQKDRPDVVIAVIQRLVEDYRQSHQ
jgi:pimeloyl-ACP methyl ester carboxylesterase